MIHSMRTVIDEMQQLPDKIAKILEDKERIQWFAGKTGKCR